MAGERWGWGGGECVGWGGGGHVPRGAEVVRGARSGRGREEEGRRVSDESDGEPKRGNPGPVCPPPPPAMPGGMGCTLISATSAGARGVWGGRPLALDRSLIARRRRARAAPQGGANPPTLHWLSFSTKWLPPRSHSQFRVLRAPHKRRTQQVHTLALTSAPHASLPRATRSQRGERSPRRPISSVKEFLLSPAPRAPPLSLPPPRASSNSTYPRPPPAHPAFGAPRVPLRAI